jgi:hypothetical protein
MELLNSVTVPCKKSTRCTPPRTLAKFLLIGRVLQDMYQGTITRGFGWILAGGQLQDVRPETLDG